MTAEMKPEYFVHESSYVDLPCQIGSDTSIWHFCHVMKNAVIGKNCRIGQNVVISPNVTIGNNVKIQNNVSVYTGVTLEDDVFCGPSMVFTNVYNPRSAVPRNTEEAFLKTLVRQGASIGANPTIVKTHLLSILYFTNIYLIFTNINRRIRISLRFIIKNKCITLHF